MQNPKQFKSEERNLFVALILIIFVLMGIKLHVLQTNLLQLTQQVAQAKVDFNVQLSPQALQNIEALKTLAATQQTNVHKLSEGKIYIPVESIKD